MISGKRNDINIAARMRAPIINQRERTDLKFSVTKNAAPASAAAHALRDSVLTRKYSTPRASAPKYAFRRRFREAIIPPITRGSMTTRKPAKYVALPNVEIADEK